MTVEEGIALARGPLFAASFAFMALGLARHLGLALWEGVRVWRRAGDRSIPLGRVTRETLEWLVPVRRLRNRWLLSLTTVLFHAGVLLVPLFLAGHVDLWRRGTGLSWPALPNGVATVLALTTMAAALAVVVQRLLFRDSRALGRFQDLALPLFIALVFGAGFLAMHPALSPVPPRAMLLVHVLGGDLLLVLVPLTKLCHMILLPFTRLIAELTWHFPPDLDGRVAAVLGKEGEPV